ncbi:ImmA/IrrE family metallo-endopeptidase [Sorangium sp. So ce861]|uniref:ImmA/IrrE family metallo-endopeptidase n=1 Tax=Sorangium sp. So ce861 TaxID=3133323 RepID=UPI003F5FC054
MKLSSTTKGDEFEAKVFKLLKRASIDGQFIGPPERCKFERKKGYYSNDRKSNIVFDISVEYYLPGHSSYFLLILIECKDYATPVPVNDAEEFHSKIEQVSGAKGVIISTNAFAQGTFEFCRSKGIGLARYYNKSTLKWELDRSPSSSAYSTPDWVDIYSGLIDTSHKSRHFDFYCHSGNVHSYSLYTLFRNLVRDIIDEANLAPAKPQTVSVDYISSEQIEASTEAILKKTAYSNGAVSLDAICEYQAAEAGLSTRTGVEPTAAESRHGMLGRISFHPLEIIVFKCAEIYRGRQRFTLAHELGHYFLGHGRHMSGEYCEEIDFERDGPADLGIEDIRRMEWQANHFASCLLLPQKNFVADFFKLAKEHDLEDRGYGMLFVDEQSCNQINFYRITDSLRLKYDVSRSAVEIRLKYFGLLNDARQRTIKRLR